MILKRLYLFSFFLLYTNSLYAIDWSIGGSLGLTSYNNDFFIRNLDETEKQENTKTKLLKHNLFAPIFKLSFDIYPLKKWRIGLEGAIRRKVRVETAETAILGENTLLNFSSAFQTRYLLLKILYEVPFDLKNIGYFGLGVGYSSNLTSYWLTTLKIKPLKDEKNEEKGEKKGDQVYEQKLEPYETSSFIVKLIVGRSYEFVPTFFFDIALEFSFIEWITTSSKIVYDMIPKDKIGIWTLNPPYDFPSRPLDLTVGIRKKF